jgi:hypothetical protein
MVIGASGEFGQVVREHFPPDGPVMGAVRADVEPVVDIFFVEFIAESFVISAAAVFVGCTEDDAHVPDGGILGAGDVVDGVIEVDIVVIVSVGEGADVENAAHGEAVSDELWVTECEVDGVVSAEAAAGDGDAGVAGLVAGSSDDLFEYESVIEALVDGAFGGRDTAIVPAVGVHAVGAVDPDLAVIEEPSCGVDETLIFCLVVGALGGREEYERVACVSEYKHLEIFACDGGVPVVIFFG